MNWFDSNEVRAYPLVEVDDFAIPHDILVDAFLHAPAGLGDRAEIFSISVTDLVVSVVIAIAGVPVAFTTQANDAALVHTPIPLTPIVAGVSGHITWGTGITKTRLRVDGPYALVDAALVSFAADITSPTLSLRGIGLPGRVSLVGGRGITISPREIDIRLEDLSVITTTAAVIELDPEFRLEPLSPCQISAEAEPLTPPIRVINGVRPDPMTGDIDLVALVVKTSTSEPDITLSSPQNGLILITDDGEPCS
jgi:hypothetical protein